MAVSFARNEGWQYDRAGGAGCGSLIVNLRPALNGRYSYVGIRDGRPRVSVGGSSATADIGLPQEVATGKCLSNPTWIAALDPQLAELASRKQSFNVRD